jgi:hypothetical protein
LQEIGRGVHTSHPILRAAFKDATIDVIVMRKRRLPRVVRTFAQLLIQAIGASRGPKITGETSD